MGDLCDHCRAIVLLADRKVLRNLADMLAVREVAETCPRCGAEIEGRTYRTRVSQ